jgi:hypothetical protein
MNKLTVVATRELLHGREVYAAGQELECSPADAQHYVDRHMAAYRTRELSAARTPPPAAVPPPAPTAAAARRPPPPAPRAARATRTGGPAGTDVEDEPAQSPASAGTPIAPMGTITARALVPPAESAAAQDVGMSASEGDPQ